MVEYKQAIVFRKDLKMGKGKLAAQACHASLEAYKKTLKKKPQWVEAWEKNNNRKIVLRVDDQQQLVELYEKTKRIIPSALIRDAGYTQLEPGTITCLGIGPAPEEKLDPYTSSLKLL